MQSKVVKILTLALVVGGVGMAMGQEKLQRGEEKLPTKRKTTRVEEEENPTSKQPKTPQKKSKLEEMLAEALKNNADIRVAAAKLAEAEAELNRTRIQVTQQVAMLYHAIETQKQVVQHAERNALRVQQAGATVAFATRDELNQKLALAKAKLAELEAQMPGLLGKAQTPMEARTRAQVTLRDLGNRSEGTGTYSITLGIADFEPDKSNIPQAEKLRKALQTPVKVDYKDMMFDAILDDLAKKAPGLSIRKVNMAPNYKISLRFEEALTISAILQAVGDEFSCSFYVREYGIVAAMPNSLPPGALKVEEFLRQKPAGESRNQSSSGKNPPQENVEGLVKNTDSSGLMTINIGSNAGLAKGHTLELFRLVTAPGEAKYLGTIRILEVEAQQAVAQAVGRLSAPAQAGDHVASRILGN